MVSFFAHNEVHCNPRAHIACCLSNLQPHCSHIRPDLTTTWSLNWFPNHFCQQNLQEMWCFHVQNMRYLKMGWVENGFLVLQWAKAVRSLFKSVKTRLRSYLSTYGMMLCWAQMELSWTAPHRWHAKICFSVWRWLGELLFSPATSDHSLFCPQPI